MFISEKSVRHAWVSALVFAIIICCIESIGRGFWSWGGIAYFVFMFISYCLHDNYRLSKQTSYKSLEVSPKFSKAELILKMSEVFYVTFPDGMLLIRDLNTTIEFLEDNKILITGSEKNVNKMRDLLSL